MAENQNWEEKYHKRSGEYQKAVSWLKQAVKVQKKNFTAMVSLLTDILTMVNRDLGSHVKSVAEYSRSLSYLLHMSKEQRDLLYYSALLHDLGLLSASKEIYDYNPLSETEPPEAYLSHPTEAEALIRPISTMGRIAGVIRAHHEYWDGSGFPDHTNGTNIPREARIICVTDTFDWLTRYGHMPPREALDAIDREKDKKFDPEIAGSFVTFMDQRLREKETGIEKVHANELRHGHILNDDLMLSNGMLLYPSGTFLNTEAIERISKFADSLAITSLIRVHQ